MENINIKEIVDNFKLGKFELAAKEVIPLLKKFPNNYFLFNLYGAILSSQKKFEEAITYIKKSIEISPNYADAYNNLAGIFAQQGKFEEAIKNFKKAIEINPNLAEAHYNLGNAFEEVNQYEESINSYNNSIKLKPNYAKAYNNLGNIFKNINEIENAITCYEKAIEFNISLPDTYNKLAILYCDIGRVSDSKKYFQKLIKLDPDNIAYKINNYLLLTPVYRSVEEINLYRNQFIEGIDQLKKYKYLTDRPSDEIELNFYYLAYHNKNNLDLLKKLSKLFRKVIPSINYTYKKNSVKKNEKKINIGFISQFMTDHTVGKLFGGLIKNLNKKKFNTTIFHTSNTNDGFIKKQIDASADKIIILKNTIHEQHAQIENENLDIIFYPDIGMSPITYFLAYARLAPIQITSWGQTETTGIDTIDYFLSSDDFENNNNNKYSEKLLSVSQIPTYFEPPENIGVLKNRSELNLPKNANLYGCPQSLFKLHPDFDFVLSEILKKDDNGYIVLIGNEGKGKFWAKILKERWAEKFPILNKRVIFTKKLSLLEFFSLSNCVDVLLVPTHFGGGNTSLEAMMFGTPSITMSGDYLRTNITSAIYKQMKISNPPIAKNTKEYIELAIKYGTNTKANKLLREKSKEAAKKYLFKSDRALKEFEKFLETIYSKIN